MVDKIGMFVVDSAVAVAVVAVAVAAVAVAVAVVAVVEDEDSFLWGALDHLDENKRIV